MNEFLELARTDFVPPADLNGLESERSFDLEDPCYYHVTNSKVNTLYSAAVFQKAKARLN